MKSLKLSFNFLSGLFLGLFLFQSCAVYEEESVSVKKAVESNSKLKLKTTHAAVYKFDEMEKDNENIYGIARMNSKTAKKLVADIVDRNYTDKFVKIAIPEESIEEIRLKYPALSTVLPAIGAIVTLGTAIIITLIMLHK